MTFIDYSTADVLTILSRVKSEPSDKIESETIEFKEFSSESSLHGSKELAEEICALANWHGGVLIVGVKDTSNLQSKDWKEQLVGFQEVDATETEKRINGKLQNLVTLRIENINFEDKNYVAMYVMHNFEALVSTTSGKICMREGRDSRPMTPEEVERAVKSLHNYDWSADVLQRVELSALDEMHVNEAFAIYKSLMEQEIDPSKEDFLESVGVTHNGILTKGGLLFLGKQNIIREQLGDYEYRFSWKEGTGLKINEVWSGNIWNTLDKAKLLFEKCVSEIDIEFKGNKYKVPNLDPVAFHEAFLNAVVHRDYAVDGMITVEFTGNELSINSPGTFYGEITTENIAYHSPRHRNKALARILMTYRFVDRAGMGILRMGIKSLVYGRKYPVFEETADSIKVSMQAEYIRPAIFVLTHGKQQLFLPDLILLNTLSEKAYISLPECADMIKKVIANTSKAIIEFSNRWDTYLEICGTKEGILLRIKDNSVDFFNLDKTIKPPLNSDKFVKLFFMLKKHKWVSNEDVSTLLGYKQSQSTSRFLSGIEWIERRGKGIASKYQLSEEYE